MDAYKRTKGVLGHDERVQVVVSITPAFFGAYEARSTLPPASLCLFSTTTYDVLHDLLLLGNSTF